MESGQDASISVGVSGRKGSRHTFSNACIAPGETGKAGWGILALHATVFSFVLFLV